MKSESNKLNDEVLITVEEAHERIGHDRISRNSIYGGIARKEIPSVRIGRRIFVPASFLRGFQVAVGAN